MLKAVLIAQRELYVYVSLYFCVGDDKPIALVRNCVPSKRKRDMIDLMLLLPFFFFLSNCCSYPHASNSKSLSTSKFIAPFRF